MRKNRQIEIKYGLLFTSIETDKLNQWLKSMNKAGEGCLYEDAVDYLKKNTGDHGYALDGKDADILGTPVYMDCLNHIFIDGTPAFFVQCSDYNLCYQLNMTKENAVYDNDKDQIEKAVRYCRKTLGLLLPDGFDYEHRLAVCIIESEKKG